MKPRLHPVVSSQGAHAVRIAAHADTSIRNDMNLFARQARNGSTRILLVHSDRDQLEEIGRRLADEADEVLAVPTFQLAKDFFHAIAPNLVVADVRLGEFNGLHLAAWIRFDPSPLRSPIIITHGGPEPVLETEARALGADFVVDPLHNPAFLTNVRAALAEYRRPQPAVARREAAKTFRVFSPAEPSERLRV
jgi:DNA-binding response OmpR family regulator